MFRHQRCQHNPDNSIDITETWKKVDLQHPNPNPRQKIVIN